MTYYSVIIVQQNQIGIVSKDSQRISDENLQSCGQERGEQKHLNIASNYLIDKMKTYKVYLNIYDFMGGNRCLQAIGVGAFHTGVEIGNKEYCYSVCSDDPDDSGVFDLEPQTADYIFNRKLYLGQATIMDYRLNQIIQELSQQFTVGKYHMFSNNCNHFSNELSKRLTKNQIPKQIFRASNILTYLCCCLPNYITNGQYAFEKVMEADRRQREQNALLLNKWEPLFK